MKIVRQENIVLCMILPAKKMTKTNTVSIFLPWI